MARIGTTQATVNYLAAREAVEVAQAALAQAEQDLKETFARNGVEQSTVNGKKVILVKSERVKYAAAKLRDLISDRLYKKVTKTEVDTTKFRAALALGEIGDDIAQAVATVTQVEAVRVYDIADEIEIAHNIKQVA